MFNQAASMLAFFESGTVVLGFGVAALTFTFLLWRLLRPFVQMQRKLYEIATRELEPNGTGTSMKDRITAIQSEQYRVDTVLKHHQDVAEMQNRELRDLLFAHVNSLDMHRQVHEIERMTDEEASDT